MPPACFLNAPTLPLMPTPNNASVSTVEHVSGSGAKGTVDASYTTIIAVFCERAVKSVKLRQSIAWADS